MPNVTAWRYAKSHGYDVEVFRGAQYYNLYHVPSGPWNSCTLTKIQSSLKWRNATRGYAKTFNIRIRGNSNGKDYAWTSQTKEDGVFTVTTTTTLASLLEEFRKEVLVANQDIRVCGWITQNRDYPSLRTRDDDFGVYIEYVIKSAPVAYYDGSNWKDCTVKYYDGTDWKDCIVRYFDGTNWNPPV